MKLIIHIIVRSVICYHQGPGDLLGWDDLPAGGQVTLQGYINQYLTSSNTTGSTGTPTPSTSSLPTTSTPAGARQGTKRTQPLPHPLVISDSESDPPTPPKSARLSPGPPLPVLPNLLEGVTIPTGPPRTFDECSVCLDLPVHPVTLPCNHIFCYLCAKVTIRTYVMHQYVCHIFMIYDVKSHSHDHHL